MELFRDAAPIREVVQALLADGKRVRLVLTPTGSQCTARFMIHSPMDVDVQVQDALDEMRRRNLPGVCVEEVLFSEDTRLPPLLEPL